MTVYRVITDGPVRELSRSCDGKNKYDKKGAITAAKIAHRAGRVKEARIYPCSDHWHIAKSRKADPRFRD